MFNQAQGELLSENKRLTSELNYVINLSKIQREDVLGMLVHIIRSEAYVLGTQLPAVTRDTNRLAYHSALA